MLKTAIFLAAKRARFRAATVLFAAVTLDDIFMLSLIINLYAFYGTIAPVNDRAVVSAARRAGVEHGVGAIAFAARALQRCGRRFNGQAGNPVCGLLKNKFKIHGDRIGRNARKRADAERDGGDGPARRLFSDRVRYFDGDAVFVHGSAFLHDHRGRTSGGFFDKGHEQ
jgi:hypothetical protein